MTFATGLFLSPDKHAECDYGQDSSHREVHIFPGTERILTMFCMTDTNRDKRETGRAQQQNSCCLRLSLVILCITVNLSLLCLQSLEQVCMCKIVCVHMWEGWRLRFCPWKIWIQFSISGLAHRRDFRKLVATLNSWADLGIVLFSFNSVLPHL